MHSRRSDLQKRRREFLEKMKLIILLNCCWLIATYQEDEQWEKYKEAYETIDAKPEVRQDIPNQYMIPTKPIGNQGECNSCWAFAAVCSIETCFRQEAGIDLRLSEQHLVNCVKNDYSCDQQLTVGQAWEYILKDFIIGKKNIIQTLD